jgi:hypothetical protein
VGLDHTTIADSKLQQPTSGVANMEFAVDVVVTKPFEGQKPGTSGLRKKVSEVAQPNYIHNFVQAIFNALPAGELKGALEDGLFLPTSTSWLATVVNFPVAPHPIDKPPQPV